MKRLFKEIPASIVAPKGFLASGVFCDIKRLGTGKGSQKGKKRDLANRFQCPHRRWYVHDQPGVRRTGQVCIARR
jgi:hypothetical protein